ncbi:MAG: hypothetical protein JHC61_10860 [Burkholderiaceae bacterium]|nr:hypothetical protein [Burkholderiaceae bacterium]
MNKQAFTITDEIERQLMLAALQDQFRPRPFQALGKFVKRAVTIARGRSAATLQAQSA